MKKYIHKLNYIIEKIYMAKVTWQKTEVNTSSFDSYNQGYKLRESEKSTRRMSNLTTEEY